MEQVLDFCKSLGNTFGRVYDGATIEDINGKPTPVYFDGKDYVSLHPKDNVKKFAYVRETAAVTFRTIDIGGCTPSYEADYRLRIVFFDPNPVNNFDVMRRFVALTAGCRIQITGMMNNMEQLYRQETQEKKVVRAKRYSYMAIDFIYTTRVDVCNVHPC
jgi:hypothetical protein